MRLATQHDVPAIMQALLAVKDKSPNPQMRHADPIAAELGVRDFIHRERAVFFGDILVLFEIGKVWYSDTLFFFEELFMRVPALNVGLPTPVAIRAMEQYARSLGCTAVAVGDTQVGHMAHAYRSEGFAFIGTQLLKG